MENQILEGLGDNCITTIGTYCHMPSPPIQKIHLHSDTAFPMSILQACLLWQLL